MAERVQAKCLPKFLCEFCGSRHNEVRRLNYHKKRHHKEHAYFECEVCDTMFSDCARLNEHKKVLHGLPILCVKCNYDSPSLSDFRAHVKRCKITWKQETEELPVLAETSVNEESSLEEPAASIFSTGEVFASNGLRLRGEVEILDVTGSKIQSCHAETKEISSPVSTDMAAGSDSMGNFNFEMRDEKPVVFPAMDIARSEQTSKRRCRSPSVEIIEEQEPVVQLKTPKLEPPSRPVSPSMESLLSRMCQPGAPQPVIRITPLELQENLPEGIRQRLFVNGANDVVRNRRAGSVASSISATGKQAPKTSGRNRKKAMVYCICRGPSANLRMVRCRKCKEWYHFICVGIPDTDAEYRRLRNKEVRWCCAGPLFVDCRMEEASVNPQSAEEQSKSKSTEANSVADEGITDIGVPMPTVEAEDDDPPAGQETAGGTTKNRVASNKRPNSRRSSGRKPQRQSSRNTQTKTKVPIVSGLNLAEHTEEDGCSSTSAGQNLRMTEPKKVVEQRDDDERPGVPTEINPSVLSVEVGRNGENLPRAGGSRDRARDTSPDAMFLGELKLQSNLDERASIGGDSGVDVDNDGGSVRGEAQMDLSSWNARRVVDFVKSVPDCAKYAVRFEKERVDGPALLLLEVAHLKSFMEMPLGPAVKLLNEIKAMNSRSAPQY